LKEALISAAMVGTGGFFGAIFRYGLSGLVHSKVSLSVFPYGTLVVNLLGCLLWVYMSFLVWPWCGSAMVW